MSASTDALNKAIDNLGSVAHDMLDKIVAEATAVKQAHAEQNTADVDTATSRIADMATQLKNQLDALATSAEASSQGAGTDATIQTSNNVQQAAPTPLSGVPVTPASDAPMTSTAVPNTDHVVTETSPNQDTSGPSVPPGAEAQPGIDNSLEASSSATKPLDTPAEPSPAAATDQPTPVAGEDAPVVTEGSAAATGTSGSETDAATTKATRRR
jgi:hypothetical protein